MKYLIPVFTILLILPISAFAEECTGLISLDKLGDNIINAGIGENKHDVFDIIWESDDNLRFEVIQTEDEGIQIEFQQPIEFQNSESGKTRSQIPYTVQIPMTECTDEQTPNCVYNDKLYELPVKTIGKSCGEDVMWDTTVMVKITNASDFDFRLLLVLLPLGLIILLIRSRKKKKKNRFSTINNKPRPQLG